MGPISVRDRRAPEGIRPAAFPPELLSDCPCANSGVNVPASLFVIDILVGTFKGSEDAVIGRQSLFSHDQFAQAVRP